MPSDLKLNITYYKILDTLCYLNNLKFYPLPEGITKIVNGIVDNETKQFLDCPTFSSLLSFNSKKVSRYTMMLHRYHYIDKIFDRNTNELYLKINQKGLDCLEKFHKSHKSSYVKKEKINKPTIVKI